MAKEIDVSNAARPCDARSRQNRINGGSSDTDENELMVSPCGVPFASVVVTIATPVAKRPQALRKLSGDSGPIGLSMGALDKVLTLILS